MSAAPEGAIDVHATLRNVVQQLQDDPRRYRCFGIYWWPVKALLKRAGYGPDQLYMLGGYQDPDTAGLVPHLGLQDTMRAALAEYGQNLRFPHPDGMVEDADGEMVQLWDEDAGF
jgi:hypothetical protein